MIYIVVKDGLIVNSIILDDPADWTTPDGCEIYQDVTNSYYIGGTYVDGVYTPPKDTIQ